jgi:beta-1,4-mannosyltransferase
MTLNVYFPKPGSNPFLALPYSHLASKGVRLGPLPSRISAEWLRTNRADEGAVLHFHWPSYSYTARDRNLMTALVREWNCNLAIARDLGYRIVWTAHNLYPHDCGEHFDLHHEARVQLIQHADGIIAYSQTGLDIVDSTFGRSKAKREIIKHGHLIDFYGPPMSREVARHLLGLPTGGRVYLFFGLIRTYKGVEKLVSIFKSSGMNYGDIVIAGAPWEASLGQHLVELIQGTPGIYLHPFHVPDYYVRVYFSAADIVVLPYTDAFTSGVIVLSHSMGKPVIAPSIGCFPDMIPEGTGFLYDPRSEEGLISALERSRELEDPSVKINCLNFAKRYDWNAVSDATLAFYRSVLTD